MTTSNELLRQLTSKPAHNETQTLRYGGKVVTSRQIFDVQQKLRLTSICHTVHARNLLSLNRLKIVQK